VSKKQESLVLIDGHAIVYRAYHAFPPLTTGEGELVNAVYGFARILLKVIKDLQPEYIGVAFDQGKPTFRHSEFAGYKAQRKETPADLLGQFGRVQEVVQALNIPIFGVEGYEADDVIGTIADGQGNKSLRVRIVTGDKDAFQLVRDGEITVYMPAHGKDEPTEYDEAGVLEKMGIPPQSIVDYKALAGDPSDNIPGIIGVGPKTAVQLLKAFKTIEGIYKALESSKELSEEQKKLLTPRLVEKLAEGHDSCILSRKLATIDRTVPLSFSLEDCRVTKYNKQKAIELFHRLGFKSLVQLLPPDEFELEVQAELF